MFCRKAEDYEQMGFKDMENCIYIDKDNFKERTQKFLNSDLREYQKIANAGRELIEQKWTAEKFADALYEHAKGIKNGK